MAFISLFHRNLKKGYIHKNVNIITLIIDDFIVLFNFRILKSKGYFRPFTRNTVTDLYNLFFDLFFLSFLQLLISHFKFHILTACLHCTKITFSPIKLTVFFLFISIIIKQSRHYNLFLSIIFLF